MKRGYISAGIVTAGLALVIAWIARNTYWDEVQVPMPMKGEARSNSLYAAQKLVTALGATAHAQRDLGSLPGPGSVIYMSYWNWSLIPSRRERLQQWVESGGRLVADRSLIGGGRELEHWSGIARSELSLDESAAAQMFEPDERCSDLQIEVEETGGAGAGRDSYLVCGVDETSRLTSGRRASWILSDERGIQALRIGIGRGSITVLNAQPFDNYRLFDGDNGLLFVAATGLDRGEHIYFLSEERTPSLLELMWAHGAPVILLLLGALALAVWRGSRRFGPPAGMPDPARRSLAEQIVGTGRFTLRFGGGRALHAAAVRALQESADRRVSGYRRLRGEERMAALARSAGLDEESLAAAINHSGPRRRGELRKAIALLETARRRIS